MSKHPRSVFARRRARALLAAVVAAIGILDVSPAVAQPGTLNRDAPLRVCVSEDAPPYSWRRGKIENGFDPEVARAVAIRLGRPLSLIWYESKYEKEIAHSTEVNALLSAPICDLLAGFTLYEPSLEPEADVARTPDHDGAKPLRQRPWIKLQMLAASRAYHSSPMTIVVARQFAERTIRSMDDLVGMRVGTSAASLGGTLLARYRKGILLKDMVTLRAIDNPLEHLDKGAFDATLVELHALDMYRLRNRNSTLQASAFRHPLNFNMGFVALERNRALLDEVDRAITTFLESGQIATLARESGVTYVPPIVPNVRPVFTLEPFHDPAEAGG